MKRDWPSTVYTVAIVLALSAAGVVLAAYGKTELATLVLGGLLGWMRPSGGSLTIPPAGGAAAVLLALALSGCGGATPAPSHAAVCAARDQATAVCEAFETATAPYCAEKSK